MHFQVDPPAAKLARCARGAILDVLVDIRPESSSFGSWEAWRLDDENMQMLFVPVGFAHGFCVLSDVAEVEYKCSALYDRDDEVGVLWSSAGIGWPLKEPLLSAKDAALPPLDELRRRLEG